MSFQDKVAIVTGGGRDIGRAVSIKLAAAGARVCLNYANDEASAQETLALIKAAGGQAIAHRADVTDPAAVAGLVAATQAAFGQRIDVLVNVAGGMVERRPLADIDPAFFHKVIDPCPDLAHQGGIAGVPGQATHSSQTGDLVEVVADSGQLPPGCSDGIQLVCLDGQTIACLSDQMPDCLGNRQTACLGNRLKGCMLVFRDADVELHRKPQHLFPIKAALDP